MFPGNHIQWQSLWMFLPLIGHNFSPMLILHIFWLVSRCVQRIIHDQASGILVIPLWTTQPYFTAVLSLLTETPRVFNASVQNLVHQTLDGPHPLHQLLQLMVCKLSGDPCKSLRFRQTLSTSSCIHGETALRNKAKSKIACFVH